MIPADWSPLANHLWQSTLFAALAGLLTLALRKNRAQMRYWLWLAASVKFLIPFSLLVSAGSQIEWRTAPAAALLPTALEQISQPFTTTDIPPVATPAPPATSPVIPVLVAVWFLGCAVVLARWYARWGRIRRAVRAASPLPIQAPVKVMSSPMLLEPGVFGLFRPVLLLPDGIANRLTPTQLQAIVAHEMCHVRRRDNLAAAIHMVVEAVFWFHPLVWWIGARLVKERERACDEEVLRLGNEPQAYAEGILNVCKFYLESPLPCASGVTGADLKKRIEAIMTNRISQKLTPARKLLLAIAGMMAVAGPVLIGIMNAPHGRAQSKPGALAFEVASIKPADPDARGVRIQFTPGGGLSAMNVRPRQLIELAYDVQSFQISGGPGWLNSQGFDIIAKAPQSPEAPAKERQMTEAHREQFRQRVQALLGERFQLVIRRDTKEMPVYALVVAKNGPRLKESTGEGTGIRAGRGEISGDKVAIAMLARILASRVGRPVLDRTGLKGNYDFKLEWTPDLGEGSAKAGGPLDKGEGASAADPSGPSIFTALQEQLGLKLESTKGPVEIIVIERAEKPTEN